MPNLLPNEEECQKFEIRANSCWGKDESCKFLIWAQFFLDNSKEKIRHKEEWKLFVLGSKLSYRPAKATHTRRTLFESIVIVIVIVTVIATMD